MYGDPSLSPKDTSNKNTIVWQQVHALWMPWILPLIKGHLFNKDRIILPYRVSLLEEDCCIYVLSCSLIHGQPFDIEIHVGEIYYEDTYWYQYMYFERFTVCSVTVVPAFWDHPLSQQNIGLKLKVILKWKDTCIYIESFSWVTVDGLKIC